MRIFILQRRSALYLLLAFLSLPALGQDLKQLRYFMQAGSSSKTAIPYGNNSKAGHYLHTGDARIYYEVYGKGKPLVILHGGIVGSSYEMSQFIDSLSMRYQVIAISTRGHGKSEIGTEIPSFERKSKDVAAIINAVTKDSVIIVGFSDGAYTGYTLAAMHPNKVKKLIAIGAGEWKQGFRSFNFNRTMLAQMDERYLEQQLKLMPEPQKFDSWLSSLNRYYNSVKFGNEILSTIHCPVMVMAGEDDQNAPLKTVISAYEMIPDAQLCIIPNAPHPVFLVNFPAVWANILPFLNPIKTSF